MSKTTVQTYNILALSGAALLSLKEVDCPILVSEREIQLPDSELMTIIPRKGATAGDMQLMVCTYKSPEEFQTAINRLLHAAGDATNINVRVHHLVDRLDSGIRPYSEAVKVITDERLKARFIKSLTKDENGVGPDPLVVNLWSEIGVTQKTLDALNRKGIFPVQDTNIDLDALFGDKAEGVARAGGGGKTIKYRGGKAKV